MSSVPSLTLTVRFGASCPVPWTVVIFRRFISPDRPFQRPSTTFCLRAWLTEKSMTGESAVMPNSLEPLTWR